jgi:glycosyltransferase involved in cell wall biosynthesis
VRIALVNYVYDRDLVEPDALLDRYRTLSDWGAALAATGRDHVIVVQRFGRDAALSRSGVEYRFCADGEPGAPSQWRWSRRVHRALIDARPDIVHVNSLEFPLQTWLLRRSFPRSAAIVVQDHASGVPPESRTPVQSVRRAVRRHAMRAADAFFFTAAQQAEGWRESGFIAPHQRVFQIPESSTTLRGMDRETARSAAKVEGIPALLWVGRLNANKDPMTVLDGFARTLVGLPDAVLTMIFSEADLLPAIEDRLRASPPLAGRVRLIGPVAHDRMTEYYSAADIFVLGSHHESCGYALLEACACGLTPVVTDIPSFRAITDAGAIAVLWTPGDAAECAAALIKASRRDRAASRERVLAHFARALSWDAIGRQAAAAYKETVDLRRSPAP